MFQIGSITKVVTALLAALVPERSAAVVVLSNSDRSVDRIALRLLNHLAVGERGTSD